MTRFINTPITTTNRFKQKTTTGRIFTSKQFQLTNNANDGISPLDTVKFDVKDSVINLAAGTAVDLTIQEMVTCNSYTISFKKDGKTYSKTLDIKGN